MGIKRVFLILTLVFLGCATLPLSGCLSRDEVRAFMFLHAPIPKEICDKTPELYNTGIYRKLNNGKYEFISYCNPLIARYFGILDKDLEEVLDKLLPENQNQGQN